VVEAGGGLVKDMEHWYTVMVKYSYPLLSFFIPRSLPVRVVREKSQKALFSIFSRRLLTASDFQCNFVLHVCSILSDLSLIYNDCQNLGNDVSFM
jgi:hypothetical protein